MSSPGASDPSGARLLPFAAGTAGIAVLLLAYYVFTWQGLIANLAVCTRQFCDFVDYYYPMGEAIFRTDRPVEGFLYSPFVGILLAVFPPLGVGVSLVLWGLLQILSLVLSLFLFRRLVPVGLPIQLLFVTLTLSSFPIVLNFVAGSVSVFMMASLLGLLVLYERGSRTAAAALGAFAAGFKFYPVIFFAPFAARRDGRFLLLAAAACGTVLLVVPALLLGSGDTLRFYGGLLDAFRDSGWVTANPHSQFFPHLVLRLAGAMGGDLHGRLPILYVMAYGVAAANMGLIALVQRAGLRHADLWSFQVVFLTIPFVLKTSWPHDFMLLSFAQAFLAWRLLEEEHQRARAAVTSVLVLTSIVCSNIVFFNLLGDFTSYGFLGFPFWANLLLLTASYVQVLPPALRQVRLAVGEGARRGGEEPPRALRGRRSQNSLGAAHDRHSRPRSVTR